MCLEDFKMGRTIYPGKVIATSVGIQRTLMCGNDNRRVGLMLSFPAFMYVDAVTNFIKLSNLTVYFDDDQTSVPILYLTNLNMPFFFDGRIHGQIVQQTLWGIAEYGGGNMPVSIIPYFTSLPIPQIQPSQV